MDPKDQPTLRQSYEDFDPLSKWEQDDGSTTLVLAVPGFSKNQLKAQLKVSGDLMLSGERPLKDNKWSRFSKTFSIPKDCTLNGIRARFDDETLRVTIQKNTATQDDAPSQPTPNQTPQPSQVAGQEQKTQKIPSGTQPSQVAGQERKTQKIPRGTSKNSIACMGLGRHREIIVNVVVVVAIVVGVALATYFTLKLKPWEKLE